MDLNLTHKVIFVAGSSKGIGLSIADHFLQEGAFVAISGRNELTLNRAYEELCQKYEAARILKICKDLTKETEIKEALEITLTHFKQIDSIICNIGNGKEPLDLDFNEETLHNSFITNFSGSALLLKHAAHRMIPQNFGNITIISSIAGVEDIKAPIAYSAQKLALHAVVKKAARFLGKHNIRVNGINPGNILCQDGVWERKLQENKEKIINYIEQEVPLKCFGKPSDIANLVVFLASDKASFLTGSMINVDGGQTCGF